MLLKLNALNKFVLLALFIVFIQPATANQNAIQTFVKGSFQPIRCSRNKRSYIVAFWSEACTYCMKKLALFGQLTQKYPDKNIISNTTDTFIEPQNIHEILASKSIFHFEKWGDANHFAERLYFNSDKRWQGERPRTYFVNKNNKMIKHLGMIDEQALKQCFAAQSAS